MTSAAPAAVTAAKAKAVEAEDYAEADGLKQRVERLKAQHPITPREERLAEALEDGNYALAAIFQRDLDAVKSNLGHLEAAAGTPGSLKLLQVLGQGLAPPNVHLRRLNRRRGRR